MQVEHGRLQLRALDRRDPHSPHVALFVVAAFALNRRHLRCHPRGERGERDEGCKYDKARVFGVYSPVGSADEGVPLLDGLRDLGGHSEVRELDRAITGQQDIGSLQRADQRATDLDFSSSTDTIHYYRGCAHAHLASKLHTNTFRAFHRILQHVSLMWSSVVFLVTIPRKV